VLKLVPESVQDDGKVGADVGTHGVYLPGEQHQRAAHSGTCESSV